MLMALLACSAITIGILRGGSLFNITQINFRWNFIILIGLSLQLILISPLSEIASLSQWTPQLYLLSMGILVFWIILNWRIPGMIILGLGLLSNTVAIAANGGYMPVSPASATLAGRIEQYEGENTSIANNSIATDHVYFWILTDILPIPKGYPFANVYSIGDILLTVGGWWLLYQTITKVRKSPQIPSNLHT